MRILIVNAHRDKVGGAESYLANVLPVLAKSGHILSFVYTHAVQSESALIDNGKLFERAWCLDEIGIRQALMAIKTWQPDIVYAHCVDPVALEAELLARFPAVLFAHGYGGTCISGRKCLSFPRFQPCSRELGPACLALYGLRRCGGKNPLTALAAWREQTTRKQLLPQYARVLVAGDHMSGEMVRNGVPAEKVVKAPLPVQPPIHNDKITPRLSQQGRLLMMGRLTDLKGGEYLLDALSMAERILERKLSLRIAGAGAEERTLRSKAIRQGLRIEFCGWLEAKQRHELLLDSDLLVVPSVWPEPFGLVGVEAGQLGIPSIAFDVGGIRDWLIPGESGEVADGSPPTSRGLAAAIARALGDPQHYVLLSAGALRSAGRFQMSTHIEVLEHALQSAAGYSSVLLSRA